MSRPPEGPLAGRLILDCSTLLPGPFVGKLLASLGARVLKIESPTRPDPARTMGSHYADLNEMKELVLIDLASTDGRARMASLVRDAHGLIEGFRPRAKKKLGLDAGTLHGLNPKICIASIVGFPEAGPLADRAGHDLNFQALSGMTSLGEGMPRLPWADLIAAYRAALGLSAAMDSVSRGGKGRRIVVPMMDAVTEVQSLLIREYREEGHVPGPGTTLFSGKYPCYRLYPTGDGRRIAVGAIEGKFWERVCAVIGRPDLLTEAYAEGERAAGVVRDLEKVFSSRKLKDWVDAFKGEDCCVEPVLAYPEVYGTDGL